MLHGVWPHQYSAAVCHSEGGAMIAGQHCVCYWVCPSMQAYRGPAVVPPQQTLLLRLPVHTQAPMVKPGEGTKHHMAPRTFHFNSSSWARPLVESCLPDAALSMHSFVLDHVLSIQVPKGRHRSGSCGKRKLLAAECYLCRAHLETRRSEHQGIL